MNRNRILLWALLGLVMSLGVAVLDYPVSQDVPDKRACPVFPDTEVNSSAALARTDALRPWSPPARIAYPRNTRLLPTQGSGPKSNHAGRWHAITSIPQTARWAVAAMPVSAPTPSASPRRYYVIALRRLLC